MRVTSRRGFNAIELAAVTAVVMLLGLALMPAVSNQVMGANMSAVGTRGRDIFVAITGANTEREPLGLPSVWPSEGGLLTNAVNDIASKVFTNSTDYFNCLFDGKNIGKACWNPFVAGLDYSKLAGAGVPAYTKGKFTAENNLWTVAMNVRDEMEDVVPVLVTRNIDASSLAAKVTEREWDKTLRFDPEWKVPYGDQAFLLIRQGGAIFKCRAKYNSYGTVYGKRTFDATVDAEGKPVVKPLKYLTPTHTVVPGERAYAEGAQRAGRLSGVSWERIKRDFGDSSRIILPVGACLGIVYLLVAGASWFNVTRYGIGVGLFHWATVVFLVSLFGGCVDGHEPRFRWTLLVLAVLTLLSGMAFVLAYRRNDRAACQRGVKWMISAPLIVCSVPAGALLLILFAEYFSFELVVALLIMVIAVLTFVVVRRKK